MHASLVQQFAATRADLGLKGWAHLSDDERKIATDRAAHDLKVMAAVIKKLGWNFAPPELTPPVADAVSQVVTVSFDKQTFRLSPEVIQNIFSAAMVAVHALEKPHEPPRADD